MFNKGTPTLQDTHTRVCTHTHTHAHAHTLVPTLCRCDAAFMSELLMKRSVVTGTPVHRLSLGAPLTQSTPSLGWLFLTLFFTQPLLAKEQHAGLYRLTPPPGFCPRVPLRVEET